MVALKNGAQIGFIKWTLVGWAKRMLIGCMKGTLNGCKKRTQFCRKKRTKFSLTLIICSVHIYPLIFCRFCLVYMLTLSVDCRRLSLYVCNPIFDTLATMFSLFADENMYCCHSQHDIFTPTTSLAQSKPATYIKPASSHRVPGHSRFPIILKSLQSQKKICAKCFQMRGSPLSSHRRTLQ